MNDSELESFDRSMRFWEAAKQESRQSEDGYVEVLAAHPLRDDAKRHRRALVLTSSITLLITCFDLRPKGLLPIDLDLSGTKELLVVGGAGAVTLYLWFEFIIHSTRDFKYWRQRMRTAHRRLLDAIDHEQAQGAESFPGTGYLEAIKEDCGRRRQLYQRDEYGEGDRQWAPYLGVGPLAWLEFRLPHCLAGISVLSSFVVLFVESWPTLTAIACRLTRR